MRFLTFKSAGSTGIAILTASGEIRGLTAAERGYPGSLDSLVAQGEEALRTAGRALSTARTIDSASIEWLPPLVAPPKIICIGLNYAAHVAEGGFQAPAYPSIFVRFNSCLIGHRAPLLRPRESDQFDYEAEMVAVIGRGGRRIRKSAALSHVIGYSVFNDASVRDYQFKTPQWTIGKNFDGTGAFGPYLVTHDEVPSGGAGLRVRTRLNGTVLQDSSTSDLIFDVATLIALLSEASTLQPGDLLVTGTPAGVGFARKPPLFMKAGDVCEVEVEGVGTLINPVIDDPAIAKVADNAT
jgi:2-keto-4-pentenoate hydratase/2-oxohepta-3-ene-1,7-dioic acid hydratase in catechol pathway